MANYIKQFFDKWGNAVFPKTREKAVYDDNDVRLDNKLTGIDGKFEKYTTVPIQVTTQSELDNVINNVSSVNRQWYRLTVHVNAELTLYGGVWYVEGFRHSDGYEWQTATTYNWSSGNVCKTRSKFNNVWSQWVDNLKSTDIVQSDTVGGANKVPSAEVTKALGLEIDALRTKVPFSCTALAGCKIAYSNCYSIEKTAYFNIAITTSDDSLFTEKRYAPCSVPQTPSSAVYSFSAVGLDSGGIPKQIHSCILGNWDRTMMLNVVGNTTKTIYISGYYDFN